MILQVYTAYPHPQAITPSQCVIVWKELVSIFLFHCEIRKGNPKLMIASIRWKVDHLLEFRYPMFSSSVYFVTSSNLSFIEPEPVFILPLPLLNIPTIVIKNRINQVTNIPVDG
jgi:hypothetical protein